MLSLRAGRGELRGGIEGGWDEGLGEETRKWGAGEDFFALVDGVGWVGVSIPYRYSIERMASSPLALTSCFQPN